MTETRPANGLPAPSPTPDRAEVVLEVVGLVKAFEGRTVLDGVSFNVRRGETVVIMGGSGCGKSTILRHLIGAYLPDSGTVRLLGCDLAEASLDEINNVRLRTGVLFQTGALYNSMTVGDNVALPMREHTGLADHIIDIMVKMKLELVGLRSFEDLMPAQVSEGMKKRVGLARAIALDPEILFYDEPTAGLDPIMAGVIDVLIMDLAHKLGVTSVIVTHDMNSAFKIADRMLMLHQGKLISDGSPDDIRNSTDERIRQFITGAPDGPIPLRMSSTDYVADLMSTDI